MIQPSHSFIPPSAASNKRLLESVHFSSSGRESRAPEGLAVPDGAWRAASFMSIVAA